MTVLILGSGGREHALAWKLSQDSEIKKVIVIPGNPGMQFTPKVETCEGNWSNKEAFLNQVKILKPDYVVVGSEAPLVSGVADWLRAENIPVVGPSKTAAQLESSKIFAKEFMSRHSISTASYKVVESFEEGVSYLKLLNLENGIVVKADGLSGGKGVVVSDDFFSAKQALYDFMENKKCNVKSDKILLEKKLKGKELSAFALCNGENFVTLGYVCDYKRVFDGDKGPNTGGMGGYLPNDWPSNQVKRKIETEVFKKTLEGLKKEKISFQGFLFAGLMIEGDEVSVIEFNVRMGDPETQILMPILDNRFTKLLHQVALDQPFESTDISSENKSCVHVVLTSQGYPAIDGSSLNINNPISYPDKFSDSLEKGIHLFFSGVSKGEKSNLVNSSGRVLGVSAVENSVKEARTSAYREIKKFNFKGMHYRNDIARR